MEKGEFGVKVLQKMIVNNKIFFEFFGENFILLVKSFKVIWIIFYSILKFEILSQDVILQDQKCDLIVLVIIQFLSLLDIVSSYFFRFKWVFQKKLRMNILIDGFWNSGFSLEFC